MALLDIMGDPNALDGSYQYGSKVQPLVFTNDNTCVFVGGRGVTYEIDPLTAKLIYTRTLPDGMDITSLATTGDQLMIGESGPHGQLLAMNTLQVYALTMRTSSLDSCSRRRHLVTQ